MKLLVVGSEVEHATSQVASESKTLKVFVPGLELRVILLPNT